MKNIFFVIAIFLSASSKAFALSEVLERVSNRVDVVVQEGGSPIVIFDLDDTLFHSGSRTLLILNEITTEPYFKSKYPQYLKILSQLTLEDIKYYLEDTLGAKGIDDKTFNEEALAYWEKRFFSDLYVTVDQPISGSVQFVNSLHASGATIVYLTGRDTPRMREGSEISIRANGLPLSDRAMLRTKPSKDIPDTDFKKMIFEDLKTHGVVVAGFDNEPSNVNAMKDAFGMADIVFLDTKHSGKPVVIYTEIQTIKDFN